MVNLHKASLPESQLAEAQKVNPNTKGQEGSGWYFLQADFFGWLGSWLFESRMWLRTNQPLGWLQPYRLVWKRLIVTNTLAYCLRPLLAKLRPYLPCLNWL